MSRPPDFIIKAMDTSTGWKSARLGCAWQDNDGKISLKIDPGVALVSGPNIHISLFPNDGTTRNDIPR